MTSYARTLLHTRGFIALTSAIIIAAVMLGITTTLSTSGYFARADSLTTEFKRVSLGLAESCANVALLQFATDYNYLSTVGENKTIDDTTLPKIERDAQNIKRECKITLNKITKIFDVSGNETGKTLEIKVQGIYRNTYSDLTITSTVQNPAAVSTDILLTPFAIIPAGADASLFPITIVPAVGSGVTSGTSLPLSNGTSYQLTAAPAPTGYATDGKWRSSADETAGCSETGQITASITNRRPVCSVYYYEVQTTPTITIIANVIGGAAVPADFSPKFDGVVVTSGTQLTTTTGTHTLTYTNVSGYTTSGWDCTSTGTISLTTGQNQVCVITFEQPSLTCADTILMLDRTSSMFGDPIFYNNHPERIADEKTAANAFVTELDKANPNPLLAIGSFPDAATRVSASIITQLTSNYTNMSANINSALANVGLPPLFPAWTNLGDAIMVANAEVRRLSTGLKKVIVLVSDGVPTRGQNGSLSNAEAWATTQANAAKNSGTQIFTIHYGDTDGRDFLASLANNSLIDHFLSTDSGYLSPNANGNDGTAWTSPTNAYNENDGGASSLGLPGARQRYYGFSFPNLTGRTIQGVEVRAVAGVLAQTSQNTGHLTPNGAGNYDSNSWSPNSGTNNSANRLNAVSNDDSSYVTTSTNGAVYTVRVANANVPANAVINSVTLFGLIGSSSGFQSTNVRFRVERGTGGGQQNDDSGRTISGTNFDSESRVMTTNPFTGQAWTVAEVNNWTTRFGVVRNSTSSAQPRVEHLYVVVNYTVPVNAACKLGVEITTNAGTSWTTPVSEQTLSSSLTAKTYGGPTSLWGRTWTSTDFTNNFRVRVQSIDPDPAANTLCTNTAPVSLDALQVRLYYSGTEIDVDAENADNDSFFIAPESSDMPAVFKSIAGTVCPAVASAAQGHLYVITTVVNNDGGLKQAADFSVNVSGAGATPATFPGATGSGTSVTLTPGGTFSVTQNTLTGYGSPIYSANCSGSLVAGETKTCVVVVDDIPPPPPPPPLPPPPSNININSWLPTP